MREPTKRQWLQKRHDESKLGPNGHGQRAEGYREGLRYALSLLDLERARREYIAKGLTAK